MMAATPTRRMILGPAVLSGALALTALHRASAAAGHRGSGHPVTVASKSDPEGMILGQILAQLLEARGVPVRPRLPLGPTQVLRGAILTGEVDLYPEYTGNGALFCQQPEDPAWRRADTAYERVRSLDRRQNDLVWFRPAPTNSGWAIAVREDMAERSRLRTLADLARHLAGGSDFKLAASSDFVRSPGALPALQHSYGFTLGPDQLLVLPGTDTAATMRAAGERLEGVNAAMVYGTDGAIAFLSLRVLEDPKGAQIVYEPAPVARGEVARRLPQLQNWLGPVFAGLTPTRMRALNAGVVVEGRPARDVARAHLRSLGLVT